MRGSFSFQGIDINEFGLTYVPEASNIYVYDRSSIKINARTFDGHNGGYFYGYSAEPKIFNLRCYFEDTNINHGLIAKINSFFSIGKEGKLVFDSRPYIYYNVIVTGVDNSKFLNQRNGYVILNFTAYYPFGRTDLLSLKTEEAFIEEKKENDYEYISAPQTVKAEIEARWREEYKKYLSNYEMNTGLISSEKISRGHADEDVNKFNNRNRLYSNAAYRGAVKPNIAELNANTAYINNDLFSIYTIYNNRILLHNGGNEKASAKIKIKPLHDMKIINRSNDTYCELTNIDDFVIRYPDEYLVIDGINGSVYRTDENNTYNIPAFLYHNSGFISLEPSMPVKRNIEAKIDNESHIISTYGEFENADVGKYMYIGKSIYEPNISEIWIDSWTKISEVKDRTEAVLEVQTYIHSSDAPEYNSWFVTCDIMPLNEIEFESEYDMLDLFEYIDFDYKHTFS